MNFLTLAYYNFFLSTPVMKLILMAGDLRHSSKIIHVDEKNAGII